MTKSRDILKGKVKRLLREQDDMGMLSDPAVLHCVSALEAFVHDLGQRMQRQAEKTGATAVTPIELKRSVLESADLSFLHDKVQAIDESDAKYLKPTRKRKASSAKKPKATAKAAKVETPAVLEATETRSARPQASTSIEEDDNYDSSDSE